MELREDHHPTPNEAISEQCQKPQTPRKKNSNNNSKMMNNKKRFTDDQIRSLESVFESETRLEPRKKLQVAKELGLQPRQVAIWFQNRRARLKSKQIEKDFMKLRDKYDNLTSRFESLKNEKQCLISQMEKLSGIMAETDDGNKVSKVSVEAEAETKPNFRQAAAMEDDSGLFGLEEFMNMDEFESADVSDHSCGRLQWLNFWT
ncbi:hypothetical protein HRI_005167500 [Hibiscus trionum]|uniref:Homeobox-leucine zipper protein n=1 Tax=Hibiscus trionum TaxID=183268 RepID=A0A9W7JKX2_HIBTR|nr:hypothetical protein HRI_005167500 [Hibiscus trionum]